MEELDGIAIIGLAGRLPGSRSLRGAWEDLLAGRVRSRRFAEAELAAAGVPAARRRHPRFVPVRAPLEDADHFDPAAFGLSLREAELVDPQHRVLLRCAAEALDDAALDPARFGGPIGIWAGCGPPSWLAHLLRHAPGLLDDAGEVAGVLATDKDHLATRVAWKLGLTGPAMTVGTACSTALVALHQACQGLLTWQCDAALVGAVSVAVPFADGHLHAEGGILAPDGVCRPFDAAAAGTLSGDGAGVLVLRRLADALRDGDPIHALIRASAVNNDGAGRLGYTAPSFEGQREVVATALALAGVDPAEVGFVCAHGTGTALGDPVEVAALRAALGEVPAALHSVKANFGHTNVAAGFASLVAAIGALRHRVLPPQANFRSLNPAIELGRLWIPTAPTPWRGRLVGVSALGMGGTNAHVLLEGPPPATTAPPGRPLVVCLSAGSEGALHRSAAALAEADPDGLAGLGARRRRPWRAAWVEPGPGELAGPPLRAGRARSGAVFVFAGQGSLRGGEARGAEGALRADLEACAEVAGPELLELLLGEPREASLRAEQAALFALGWALARRWLAAGLRPEALIGHSGGEYVAAAVAGLLPWEAALRLCLRRAELLAGAPAGQLVHVAADPEALGPLLGDSAWLALRNGPRATVVATSAAGAAAFEAACVGAGLAARRVRASFVAHSPLLAPLRPALEAAATGLVAGPGNFPVHSCVDGALLGARAADPRHWGRHLVEPVDMVAAFAAAGGGVLVEIGPVGSVRGLVQLNRADAAFVAAPSDGGALAWARARAEAWVAGLEPELPLGPRRHLPPVAFEERRCWIGPHPQGGEVAAEPTRPASPATGPVARPRLPRPELAVPWRAPAGEAERLLVELCGELLGVEGVGADDDFFGLGGDSLVTLRLLEAVEARTGRRLPPEAAYGGLSPAQLARFFPAEAGGPGAPAADPVLVPFRTTGSRPPLFFAHPLTGVVFPYFPLARALGEEQPFYGLQAAHLDGGGRHDRTVEEMGARYLEAIRRARPRGPYLLGGYSFGALVAYELALRLREAGEEVALLALVDEAAPVPGHRPGLGAFVQLFRGESGRNFARHFQDYAWLVREDAGKLGRRAALRRFVGRSTLAALLPPDTWRHSLGQAGLDRLLLLLVEHMRATYAYTPPPYAGSATLFRSAWTRASFASAPGGAQLGWDRLVRGGIDVRDCDGDHLGMLREPYAGVLARQLRLAIDKALK